MTPTIATPYFHRARGYRAIPYAITPNLVAFYAAEPGRHPGQWIAINQTTTSRRYFEANYAERTSK